MKATVADLILDLCRFSYFAQIPKETRFPCRDLPHNDYGIWYRSFITVSTGQSRNKTGRPDTKRNKIHCI